MKLKLTLLTMILENQPSPNKYSKAFLNLKNVFELEKTEGFNIPESIVLKFNELENQYLNFISCIPLIVIERYFFDHKENLNKFVYLEYNNHELSDMRIIELFKKLEDYFNDIFSISCNMANYYNLEIKLSKSDNSEKKYV